MTNLTAEARERLRETQKLKASYAASCARDNFKDLAKLYQREADDLAAALAVIDRLQLNADQLPIVPGEVYYFDSSKRYRQFSDTPAIQPVEVSLLMYSELYGVIVVENSELHSTPEAAAAAKEARDE